MQLARFDLDGPLLLEPRVFRDERGHFFELGRAATFQEWGIGQLVQDNQSGSRSGVLRGLHYQKRNPQGKLVRVLQGAIFDVAVDLRPGSVTFGQHVHVTLSEESRQMFWVPPGFAHGFYVLSAWAEVHYRCTAYYEPADERVLLWSDPALSIPWPLQGDQCPLLSEKDASGAPLDQLDLAGPVRDA